MRTFLKGSHYFVRPPDLLSFLLPLLLLSSPALVSYSTGTEVARSTVEANLLSFLILPPHHNSCMILSKNTHSLDTDLKVSKKLLRS